MQKIDYAVLQIGSSSVAAMIGRRGVAETFIVSGEGKSEYSGYSDGAFCEPDKLMHVIGRAISSAEAESRTKVTKLYVGVPTDFTRVAVKDVSINLQKSRKVTLEDIAELFESGNGFRTKKDLKLINKAPVYYTTDDNRKVLDVYGQKTERLFAKASYILAETAFVSAVDKVLRELGVEEIEYVSAALAEFLFLFDSASRVQPVILVDVGNINSSVIIGQGDGLLSVNSFGCGGGFFATDLSMCLHIPFDIADKLKRKAVLSLRVDENDKYQVPYKGKVLSYPGLDTNSIILSRLEQMCQIIKRSIDTSPASPPAHLPVYLTGGGLCHLKGAKDFMSKQIGRAVLPIAPKQPLFNKPELSQILSLMDLALSVNNG